MGDLQSVLNLLEQRELDAFFASAEFWNHYRQLDQEAIYDFLNALDSKGGDRRTI